METELLISKHAEKLPVLLRPATELPCTRAAAARAVAELVVRLQVCDSVFVHVAVTLCLVFVAGSVT